MRIFVYIVTAILALSVLVPLFLGGLKGGWVVVTLITVGFLWSLVLWTGMPGALRVVFLVLVSILGLVCVMGALASINEGLTRKFDLPRNDPAVTMGPSDSKVRIAIVYHPGGSPFPKRVVTALGEKLAAQGCSIVIMTANPGLNFKQTDFDALVLSSPVYGGKVRPPLLDFVSARAPFSMPVYAVLTGGLKGWDEHNLKALSDALAASKVTTTAAIKVNTKMNAAELDAALSDFAGIVMK
jgi:hypothetical protein